jgi:NADPH:quinone reductase-like Zn-dependent oxidoreductase
MKALVQSRYGAIEFGVADTPVAGDNEVLVQVRAAAVNAYDWHIMRGDPYIVRLMSPSMFGLRGPKRSIRGRDLAGTVAAVGRNVTRFHPGDEVFGDLGPADGAFAEYAAVPEDQLVPKPARLSFEQAAAVPLAASTALQGLRDLRSGQRILINGASGGVGTFAVQLAKHMGAHVTGVCRTRNVEMVHDLGADHVIDYTRDDFARAGSTYDTVFDLVGNRSLKDLRRVLTSTGTLVLSGGGVSTGGSLLGPLRLILRTQLASRFVRHNLTVLTTTPTSATLAEVAHIINSGAVTPVIDRTYPLSETVEAIRYVEVDHARAKVVITV